MILVFSGTGNSRRIADRLAELLGDTTANIVGSTPTIAAGERVVWVFPVYSWGVPPVVRQQIQKMDLSSAGDNIAVMTCGDDCGLTHKMWRRDIAKAGGRALATYSVQMPNTYISMKGFDVDSDSVAQAKLDAAESRVIEIAENIKSGKLCDDVAKGSFAMFKTGIVYPWFMRYAMSPRPFHATEACTGCASCAKYCPLNNIGMTDGRPCWGKQCAGCLRCYHLCPHHAVAYGKATAGKGQWRGSLKWVYRTMADSK